MVNPKTVERLVNQQRETGSLEPKKAGNPTPSQFEEQKELLIATVESHLGWTLEQYCEEIGAKKGFYVNTGAICRYLCKQKLTLKKRHIGVKKRQVKNVSRKN